MNHSQVLSVTSPLRIERVRDFAAVSGRVCISAIFLITGLGKIGTYSGTVGYMESAGIPGALLPLVILTEVLGAVAIILGYRTRIAAFLLAGFTLLSALAFHYDLADPGQTLHLLKNLSIVGGLLTLTANGPGTFSVDQRLVSRTQAHQDDAE